MSTQNRISRRVAAIAPSATLAVDAKAKALKAAGEPVIGFGAGEPDFPTPAHVVEAAIAACRTPRTTGTRRRPGCPRCARPSRPRPCATPGSRSAADQVVVTNGGKHAVYNTSQVLLDPGDEMLLPAPYWTTYPEPVALAGRHHDGVAHRRRQRLPGHRRPARGGPDRRAPRR